MSREWCTRVISIWGTLAGVVSLGNLHLGYMSMGVSLGNLHLCYMSKEWCNRVISIWGKLAGGGVIGLSLSGVN